MSATSTLPAAHTPAAPEPGSGLAQLRILISCRDRPGIVAAVSRFLLGLEANILRSDQYTTDPEHGTFYLRMEFTLPAGLRDELEARFAQEVGERFSMTWRLGDASRPKRVAILVSRYDHCLQDLLWRARRAELHAVPTVVISNHADLRADVEAFAVPYHHIPVTKDTKAAAETRLLDVLGSEVDLVVLARYMQVLTGDFLERVGVPVINIHHSFLPAFAGANPYERAKEGGVKLVGATAHYVTEELDAGPIIEQDVARVTHHDDVDSLKRLGADIERAVLTRAVRWHCEDRVLRHGNTTVVF